MKEMKGRQTTAKQISDYIQNVQGNYLLVRDAAAYKQKETQLQAAQQRIMSISGSETIIHDQETVQRYSLESPKNAAEFEEYISSVQSIQSYQQKIKQQMATGDGKIIQQFQDYSTNVNKVLGRYGGQAHVETIFNQVNKDQTELSTNGNIARLQAKIQNKKLTDYRSNMTYL